MFDWSYVTRWKKCEKILEDNDAKEKKRWSLLKICEKNLSNVLVSEIVVTSIGVLGFVLCMRSDLSFYSVIKIYENWKNPWIKQWKFYILNYEITVSTHRRLDFSFVPV